jgi:hypothetical protein
MIVKYICVVVWILFITLAAYWELKDDQRIKHLPNIKDITDEKQKIEWYEFYACFSSNNYVVWRSIFIMSSVATLCILYLTSQRSTVTLNFAIIVFSVIFTTFYLGIQCKNFHTHRPLCSRVKDFKIL